MPEDPQGYERCGFDGARMREAREVEIKDTSYSVWKCTADPRHTKTVEQK